MRTRFGSLILLFGALLSLALLAGCGDDDSSGGSDADPQEVLDAALGGDQQIDSGVLELSFDLEATGAEPGTLTASLEGPFQSGEEGALPELDLTASASVDAADTQFDFTGGLTLLSDAAYITYNDTAYQLDEPTFALLQQSYEQSAQLQESEGDAGSLQALGVDPATWLTDLTNEGTEDLDGTEVIHISGTADVGAIVADLTSIAEQTGQAEQLDQASLDQLEESVSNATVDVYANSEDDTLRQLDLGVDIDDPESDGTVTVGFTIGIADPNSDQEISAPEDPQPLAGLLEQIPGGAGALGGLGGLGAASGTGGATGATGGDPAAEYYDCAASAETEADLQACSELLVP